LQDRWYLSIFPFVSELVEIPDWREALGLRFSSWFGGLNDVLHTNSLERVHRDLGALPTRGHLLICIRELDLVAIIDLTGSRVIWSWGDGILDRPHQPSVTRGGNVLVFDNGPRRGHSRVLEVDPESGGILWQYTANPPSDFFTLGQGGAQELANGNILITESESGRAFEVTRSGKIVWEYYNPELKEVDGSTLRGAIYRMTRVESPLVERLVSEGHGARRSDD